MSPIRLAAATVLTMIAFAANSLFARLALRDTTIDAASFTSIRLVCGGLVLTAIALATKRSVLAHGDFVSASALFVYAICFSFAYLALPAGTGALLLFAAVQATMIGRGFALGERFRPVQSIGLAAAVVGLVVLTLPGLGAPDPLAAAAMGAAGVAWGVYSLRGRGARDGVAVTAGNFVRAAPIALGASLVMRAHVSLDAMGVVWAAASGALASGLGYAVWYTVLPNLAATTAATLQLTVPPIAAGLAVLFLGEPASSRLLVAATSILGGIALVILWRPSAALPARAAPVPSPETDADRRT